MGLINWIFDIYQHTQIDKARTEAAAARAELSRVHGGGHSPRLQEAVEEIALATKTLQRMLVEKGVCSSAEFEKTLQAIDREDGVEDGRSRLR